MLCASRKPPPGLQIHTPSILWVREALRFSLLASGYTTLLLPKFSKNCCHWSQSCLGREGERLRPISQKNSAEKGHQGCQLESTGQSQLCHSAPKGAAGGPMGVTSQTPSFSCKTKTDARARDGRGILKTQKSLGHPQLSLCPPSLLYSAQLSLW